VSTVRALTPAAEALLQDGIILRFTNILTAAAEAEKAVSRQEGGTHADEIETSMMLYIDPASVDMKKAVKDYQPGTGGLTRDAKATGTYSPTGIYGDPTLATREKGKRVVEALVSAIVKDIDDLRAMPAPSSGRR
jgi:creatinine amidohydrolase